MKKSINTRPPAPRCSIEIRVPKVSRSLDSSVRISGSKGSFLRARSTAILREMSSAALTFIFLCKISSKSERCSSGRSLSIKRGRVCPSEMRPSFNALCISSGSCKMRTKFATYSRDFPSRAPISVCESPNSFWRRLNAIPRSRAFKSSRWMFSTIAISSFTFSAGSSRMMTGTSARPASFEARRRRSPAISSYSFIMPEGVNFSVRTTTRGCNTPYCLMESESSASFTASNSCRGWRGFGFTLSTSMKKMLGSLWWGFDSCITLRIIERERIDNAEKCP